MKGTKAGLLKFSWSDSVLSYSNMIASDCLFYILRAKLSLFRHLGQNTARNAGHRRQVIFNLLGFPQSFQIVHTDLNNFTIFVTSEHLYIKTTNFLLNLFF